LFGVEFLLGSDLFLIALVEEEEEAEEDEEESFKLFSFDSSISICSCLHSLLQNGVFPLQNLTTAQSTHQNLTHHSIVKTITLSYNKVLLNKIYIWVLKINN